MGSKKVSGLAEAEYAVDVALEARFDELFVDARAAENAFRKAQAAAAPNEELYLLARKLDAALTDVMRTAYAAARAEIGPRGYDDRIYRRKARAKPAVHVWADEAERLLTLRETHRLTGIPPVLRSGPYAGESPAQPQVPPYSPDQPEPIRLERIRQMTQATASTNLDKPFSVKHALWSTPQRRLRSIIAVGALVTGAAVLAFSSGIGITFLIFGAFTSAHFFFDIAVERLGWSKRYEEQQSGFAQFVDASQTAVITAAATILGLITAFSGGALPAAAKVAVIGLGGGVLVMFVGRSSQARNSPAPAARVLGACADVIGFSLFTLGLIGIMVSLFITGGLGNRSTHGHTSSAISAPEFTAMKGYRQANRIDG
jgi:hypothetical protein